MSERRITFTVSQEIVAESQLQFVEHCLVVSPENPTKEHVIRDLIAEIRRQRAEIQCLKTQLAWLPIENAPQDGELCLIGSYRLGVFQFANERPE